LHIVLEFYSQKIKISSGSKGLKVYVAAISAYHTPLGAFLHPRPIYVP